MDKKFIFGITIGGAAVAALYFVSKKRRITQLLMQMLTVKR